MIATFRSTTRRRPVLVVAAWVLAALASVVAATAFPTTETDEDLAFLPEDSASAEYLAQHLRDRRTDPPAETATLAVPTPDGAEAALPEVERLAQLLRSDAEGSRMAVDDPVVSPDSGLVVLDVELRVDEDELVDAVTRLRELCEEWQTTSGLTAYVTGEGGVDADLDAGDVDLWLLVCSVVVVAVILGLVYRSPTLWLLPVATGVVAVLVARGLVLLLPHLSVTVTELTGSIGTVVVFGVCTDYALLLLNRLRRSPSSHDRGEAVAAAYREVRQPVLVSAATIVLAVLALSFSPIPGISGLGPALAVGVACAAAASLTLLPALLDLTGRRVRPATGPGAWDRAAATVLRRPWVALGGAAVVLVCLGAAAFSWSSSADPLVNIDDSADSKRGALLVREHFGASATSPLMVSFSAAAPRDAVADLSDATESQGLATGVLGTEQVGDRTEVALVLATDPYSRSWADAAEQVRTIATGIDPGALVGGAAAEALDREEAVQSQLLHHAPVVLAALLVALWVWLRSLQASLVVIASGCLACLAAVGASVAAPTSLTGSAQSSAEVLLFGLLFLTAFGVDYLVFLVDGIRRAPAGTRRRRVAAGLASTGPVITSAGVVLAATFAVLLLVPETNVRQVGLLVAAGVLIDTLVVRTLLVPHLLARTGGRWA
ncbi:hypothetical protein DJ010_16285 [Nocardioides silvaticus]|uniref:SSD domain-containing protein n=1 Tax=Nocardioides silvaticus TaxID=2201891 RepID=A0A316TE63_9ACTN|nr:MMPL family transporter [Nocardioides silvaticus]PWN02078.1 hypothetical protein DJ010_16285 [Nocardioides silvaticus]